MNFKKLSLLVYRKEDAIRYLQEIGILHRTRHCAKGHLMTLNVTAERERWRCHHAGCRSDKCLRTGTWLSGTHLPYTTVCLFMYSWAQEMTTMKFCKRELEMISDETITDWNNYMREACAETLLLHPMSIGGDEMHVEIDESLFVRRKYNVGRAVGQQWVFGGYCRETRKSFIFAVPDRSATTLLPVISDCILPNTTIISDKWAAYRGIADITDRNYTHLTVDHSRNFVDPITGANTNSVESMWAKAKLRNKKQWGTHRTMLDSYLCEYMWRERNNDNDLYNAIINDIVSIYPLDQ